MHKNVALRWSDYKGYYTCVLIIIYSYKIKLGVQKLKKNSHPSQFFLPQMSPYPLYLCIVVGEDTYLVQREPILDQQLDLHMYISTHEKRIYVLSIAPFTKQYKIVSNFQ